MRERSRSNAPAEASETLTAIVDAFEEAQRAGLPKNAQLYDAISNLISAGKIDEGTKLPGERELSAALKLSLGTVQKSLNALMNDGELIREHGRGTFARANRHALSELWHYRFRDPETQNLLPVYAKVVDRALVKQDPVLRHALGADELGYVRIRRLINIDDRFGCWSEMFLGATRFKRLLKLPISDVESANLKQVLNEKFNAPTLAVSQTGRIQSADREVAKHLGVRGGTQCLLLHIIATSRRREPITLQKIYVPPVAYDMELTDGPGESTKSSLAA
jgi:GntR family transcriptional regulator